MTPGAGEWAAAPAAATERILVCTALPRDRELTGQILDEAGHEVLSCVSTEDLFDQAEDGAGLLLLGEEILDESSLDRLLRALDDQPVWSDLPLLVLTRGNGRVQELVECLGPVASVTLLERPVRIATLVSAVRSGLRARRRQYEVRELLDRLAESDRRKDEFLAMLGHELRNPLSAISTAVELVDLERLDEGSRHRQGALISRQLRHLSRIVDDLLDLSRLSRGKIDLRREPLDLMTVVDQAVQTLELAGKNTRHDLRFYLGDAPLPVHGDPIRLEQAVSNLLANAIKYTPEGGRVEVAARRRGDRGVIRVKDQGMGIEPEELEGIFEPFAQSAPSTSETEGGLGVGLFLTRRLIELHGGSVEGRSEGPGKGAEFVISLPLAATAGGERARPEERRRGDGSGPGLAGLSVLLVEDNPGSREALGQLLEVWGCEVTAAANGAEAVERGVEARPEVALIDIQLPDFDGYEVAARLRRDLGEECGTLVALTGYGQPGDRRRALDAGFDQHLVKPIDPQELSELLAGFAARIAGGSTGDGAEGSGPEG